MDNAVFSPPKPPTEAVRLRQKARDLAVSDSRARDWLYPIKPGDQDWTDENEWEELKPHQAHTPAFRKRIAAILTLMAAGMAQSRIARKFQVHEDRIAWYLNEARQLGYLFPDRTAPEVLNEILTPMALETMLFHLGRKDKSTAIKHLEGLGLYQSHQAIKTSGPAAATAFKVAFSTPEGGQVTLQAGQVLGIPKGPQDAPQDSQE
ncbi:hypothetical protein LCGC14_1258570 [marine sediment metagenome]|uniref:Uncharacterized protein n=1 Tax=marine sediment metagenome TaxID=412755 RepID=A0A0F9P4R8_9ZZZZ